MLKLTVCKLILLLGLFTATAQAESDGYIYVGRTTGNWGLVRSIITHQKQPLETRVKYSGSQAPNVLVVDGASTITAIGRPAEYIAKAIVPEKKASVPAKPLRLLITDGEKVLATASEIIPGSKVYSAARHALLGLNALSLTESFRQQGLDINDYNLY